MDAPGDLQAVPCPQYAHICILWPYFQPRSKCASITDTRESTDNAVWDSGVSESIQWFAERRCVDIINTHSFPWGSQTEPRNLSSLLYCRWCDTRCGSPCSIYPRAIARVSSKHVHLHVNATQPVQGTCHPPDPPSTPHSHPVTVLGRRFKNFARWKGQTHIHCLTHGQPDMARCVSGLTLHQSL